MPARSPRNLDALLPSPENIVSSIGENVFRATVTGTSGNQVTITSRRLNGTFPRLVSYASPTANDEVVVAKLGSGWIVLGEITR